MGDKSDIRSCDFVLLKGKGLEGLGIVEDVVSGKAKIIFIDEDSEWCGIRHKVSDLVLLSKDEIFEYLEQVKANSSEYAFFIMQLNSMPELKTFHIEEDDLVATLRQEFELSGGF